MKTTNKWLTVTVVSLLAFALTMASSYASGKEMKNTAAEVRVSKIIGSKIKDDHGAKLGKIKEMVVDPQDPGRILFAVVKPLGALSLGHDRWLAIPFTALSRDGTEDYYVLRMTREQLRKAPTFDEDHRPNFADRNWNDLVYRFYGLTPYWTEMTQSQEKK